MATFPSLFDAPTAPVLSTSADWISQALFSGVAEGLCVVAVVFVGFMLMAGRLVVRDAARVILGCFVLLAAPTIAAGLWKLAERGIQPVAPQAVVDADFPAPANLPPANYDPYAGASLRTE